MDFTQYFTKDLTQDFTDDFTKVFTKNLMGWMDGMGRNIKGVLQFCSYFEGTQIMYTCTYMYPQKLSPTFLWVSKFDVKLGVVVKNFKITAGR